MKFLKISLFVILLSSISVSVSAQDTTTNSAKTEQVIDSTTAVVEKTSTVVEPKKMDEDSSGKSVSTDKLSFVQTLKKYFIDGDWRFMSLVLVCLILGLMLVIERIITLNLAAVNKDKLIDKLEMNIGDGNIDGALEVCKSTPGPIASIMYEGIRKAKQGESLEQVEKSVVSYGSVQMGLIEKGLVWISLFISIAPLFGFMGTVIGMIGAMDKIAQFGEMNAQQIAGDLKVALLTTVFGLVTAVILQIGYNYIVAKIDSIVNDMEDASIDIMDILIDNNVIKSLRNK